MTTAKPVNPGQLQTEALAETGSPNTHLHLTLLGAVASDGIAPAGATLLCCDEAGSSGTIEPCSFCVTAYNVHVAAPNPPPTDPLASHKQALETAYQADISSGHPSQATLTALQNLLTAMAPH